MPRFERSDRSSYVLLTSELLDNTSSLLAAYRSILAQSESYPMLSFREVCEWAKDIHFIDPRWYSLSQLEADFTLSKTTERQKQIKRAATKNDRKKSMARIMNSLTKKKEENFPENLLTRFHFMELIVRMSITKYEKQGEGADPQHCVRRFMKEHLLPHLKSREGKESQAAKTYFEETLFPDRDVQKFLFLN